MSADQKKVTNKRIRLIADVAMTMDRLNYKISRYEEAVKTGVLTWDTECIRKD